MMRRVLLTVGMVTAMLAVFAGPASAASYGGLTVTASKTTVAPGDTITVSGTGATANCAMTASIGTTQIGSGTASATGSYSFNVTIPTTASGTVSVSVKCPPSQAATLSLTVSGAGPVVTSATALARTGSSDAVPATTVAIGLITAGAVALGISRRRRHGSNAA